MQQYIHISLIINTHCFYRPRTVELTSSILGGVPRLPQKWNQTRPTSASQSIGIRGASTVLRTCCCKVDLVAMCLPPG